MLRLAKRMQVRPREHHHVQANIWLGHAAQGVPECTNRTTEGCTAQAVSATSTVVDGVPLFPKGIHFNHSLSYPAPLATNQNSQTQHTAIHYAQFVDPSMLEGEGASY